MASSASVTSHDTLCRAPEVPLGDQPQRQLIPTAVIPPNAVNEVFSLLCNRNFTVSSNFSSTTLFELHKGTSTSYLC
jgi:hypothetical protein